MAKKSKKQATIDPTTEAPATIPMPAAPAKTKEPKAAKVKSPKAKKEPKTKGRPIKEKKVSALDAAAQVLTDADSPMTSRELIEAMAAKGLWSSPNGQTPEATLYAAIIREIGKKGNESRFAKAERGKFTATGKGA